jgi:hypothetical protein
MEKSLIELTEELEQEALLRKQRAFHSSLNQPNLIALNSKDTEIANSQSGFTNLTINLPRPALEVDTIQLVNANIPQCVQNIPDTACVFWYYRLSQYSGTVPNPNNLFMVRLLPTAYKPEYIGYASRYGFNKTFTDYPTLATELALSCTNDLAYDNSYIYDPFLSRNYIAPFLPSEITLTYSSYYNKFQFAGMNATTQLAYKRYGSGVTYGLNDVVSIGLYTYISLQAGNIGHSPPTNPLYWKQIYVEKVATWSSTTPYPAGRLVAYFDLCFQSLQSTFNNDPIGSSGYWVQVFDTGQTNYRYLSAGYADPNVALLQGTGNQLWNQYGLYETSAIVEYQGTYWSAVFQNQALEPFSTSVSTAWNSSTNYVKGQVVSYSGYYYKATQNNLNQTPYAFSPIWTISAWIPSAIAPNVVGLYSTTSAVDMAARVSGFSLIPFPVGVAGQPYSKTPKRILNTILGFSWNGRMNPAILANIPTFDAVSVISTTNTELYNRLRPIPPYITPTLGVTYLGGEPAAVTTYTADGYCNLVYSSVMSIYCSAVFGSTLDSTRNTNLLALGTMNCGNLGVSFFNPIVNNPLFVKGDLYSINLTFFDEAGDPYYFTNNAVLTFVLKITYKKNDDLQ